MASDRHHEIDECHLSDLEGYPAKVIWDHHDVNGILCGDQCSGLEIFQFLPRLSSSCQYSVVVGVAQWITCILWQDSSWSFYSVYPQYSTPFVNPGWFLRMISLALGNNKCVMHTPTNENLAGFWIIEFRCRLYSASLIDHLLTSSCGLPHWMWALPGILEILLTNICATLSWGTRVSHHLKTSPWVLQFLSLNDD